MWFKSLDKDEKKTTGRISIRIPKRYQEKMEKAKGDDSWLMLLIDGARYRGEEIKITSLPRSRYKTHYYCSHCVEWIPHEKGVYKVARAFVRCPTCMLPLRTRGLSNKKNWNEWGQDE